MSFPKMTDLFLVKESLDGQNWTSNGIRYNVGKLVEWAKNHGYEPEEIDITLLKKGYDKTNCDEKKDSEEFWERAEKAGDKPILVVVEEDGWHWIADGNHRYARSVRDGNDTIFGYKIMMDDLPAEAINPKKE